ncbi:MAG: hypothetical protein J6I53_09700 [Treponema sp.]|nr:hypothetical protein [Treponema sp.]
MKKIFLIFAAAVMLSSCVATKREEVKMHYKCEIVYERIELPPPDVLDGSEALIGGDSAVVFVSRSDGGAWTIDLFGTPLIPEQNIEETDSGFLLDFSEYGFEVSRWRFFFKEIAGEPCLYKIEPSGADSQTITPPIKISELNADKINELLGGRK